MNHKQSGLGTAVEPADKQACLLFVFVHLVFGDRNRVRGCHLQSCMYVCCWLQSLYVASGHTNAASPQTDGVMRAYFSIQA